MLHKQKVKQVDVLNFLGVGLSRNFISKTRSWSTKCIKNVEWKNKYSVLRKFPWSYWETPVVIPVRFLRGSTSMICFLICVVISVFVKSDSFFFFKFWKDKKMTLLRSLNTGNNTKSETGKVRKKEEKGRPHPK